MTTGDNLPDDGGIAVLETCNGNDTEYLSASNNGYTCDADDPPPYSLLSESEPEIEDSKCEAKTKDNKCGPCTPVVAISLCVVLIIVAVGAGMLIIVQQTECKVVEIGVPACLSECDRYGGWCNKTDGHYVCQCNDGYNGTLCENYIGECASDPCQNAEKCVDMINGYVCHCDVGYKGVNCQEIEETVPVCTDYMGVANGDIPNANMQASSIVASGYEAYKGRLNGYGQWVAHSAIDNVPWIQADIGYQTYVSGVITQGDGVTGQWADWVASFKVSTFLSSGSAEIFIMNGNQVMIFPGNEDSTGTKTTYFPAVYAQIVRITCLENGGLNSLSMRFEILGCKTCNAGYHGDGTSCQDIDECKTSDSCDNNAECSNTIGSFSCTCNAGYHGDGTSCQDINECTTNADNCDNNAECRNNIGSFSCSCNAGYSGDGVSCEAIPVCTDYMGVANGDIPNANMQASSIVGSGYEAYKGRLNRPGQWVAHSAIDNVPWIQADIDYQTYVSGVITQGDGVTGQWADWVTSFKVSTFLSSGSAEIFIMNGNQVMIFPGNEDSTGTKTTYFPAVYAQIVRITCLENGGLNSLSMRFEILGCKNN